MSFRSWGPKKSPIFAVAGATSQTNYTAQAALKGNSQTVMVVNTDAANRAILVFWNSVRTGTPPTITLPAAGAAVGPFPNGVSAVMVPPGARFGVSVPVDFDSVGSIASAAMTNPMYIQRGEGST